MRNTQVILIFLIIAAASSGSCILKPDSDDKKVHDSDNLLQRDNVIKLHGGTIRGDTTSKCLALVFTGDEYADGGEFILSALEDENVKASFFLTGNFYRNPEFRSLVKRLKEAGHYLGSHSDRHLLYCDWSFRDSLLISKKEFLDDLNNSYKELEKINIRSYQAGFFLPPYEWYNDTIAKWTDEAGLRLVNFTPGTLSTADYTIPEPGSKYVDSKTIYESILNYEQNSGNGLNGFILLLHIGTDPRRKDKFYLYLPSLIREIKGKGYSFVRIDELQGL